MNTGLIVSETAFGLNQKILFVDRKSGETKELIYSADVKSQTSLWRHLGLLVKGLRRIYVKEGEIVFLELNGSKVIGPFKDLDYIDCPRKIKPLIFATGPTILDITLKSKNQWFLEYLSLELEILPTITIDFVKNRRFIYEKILACMRGEEAHKYVNGGIFVPTLQDPETKKVVKGCLLIKQFTLIKKDVESENRNGQDCASLERYLNLR
jgi:hypothetical protein